MSTKKLEDRVKRTKTGEEEVEEEVAAISAGPVDKVIELAFNPTRDKIREVTIIDRIQGRLFPQLDMINLGRRYCLEVAYYRQDKENFKRLFKKDSPIQPDLIDEFQYRTAQWQKSIAGKNLERAIDLALAETEAKVGDEEPGGYGADAFKED